jgi:hypothetical protein
MRASSKFISYNKKKENKFLVIQIFFLHEMQMNIGECRIFECRESKLKKSAVKFISLMNRNACTNFDSTYF